MFSQFRTFWITWICIIAFDAVFGEIFAECEDLETFNTFVASRKSCAKYIFCDGVNSFEGECLADNIFNEVEGNCDDPTAVVCHVDNNANGNDIGQNNGSNNGNTGGNTINWTLPSGPFVGNGNEPGSIPFVQFPNGLPPNFNPMFTTSSPNEPLMQDTVCALSLGNTDLILLPNPTSCTSFYTCYNGIAIPMVCERNMYFNAQKGKCEPQELVQCGLDQPVRLQCLKGVYDFIPHPRNCEYYYFCSNGFLMIFQCPLQYRWDYERRTCVHQSQSKCFSSRTFIEMLLT